MRGRGSRQGRRMHRDPGGSRFQQAVCCDREHEIAVRVTVGRLLLKEVAVEDEGPLRRSLTTFRRSDRSRSRLCLFGILADPHFYAGNGMSADLEDLRRDYLWGILTRE